MKPIISLKDLEDMVRSGKDFRALTADALLTPSARDLLRDLENPAPHKIATLEGVRPGPPEKPITSKSSKAEIEAFFNSPQVNAYKSQLCDIGRRLWQRAYVDGNG